MNALLAVGGGFLLAVAVLASTSLLSFQRRNIEAPSDRTRDAYADPVADTTTDLFVVLTVDVPSLTVSR